jgi:hypothetical protein
MWESTKGGDDVILRHNCSPSIDSPIDLGSNGERKTGGVEIGRSSNFRDDPWQAGCWRSSSRRGSHQLQQIRGGEVAMSTGCARDDVASRAAVDFRAVGAAKFLIVGWRWILISRGPGSGSKDQCSGMWESTKGGLAAELSVALELRVGDRGTCAKFRSIK